MSDDLKKWTNVQNAHVEYYDIHNTYTLTITENDIKESYTTKDGEMRGWYGLWWSPMWAAKLWIYGGGSGGEQAGGVHFVTESGGENLTKYVAANQPETTDVTYLMEAIGNSKGVLLKKGTLAEEVDSGLGRVQQMWGIMVKPRDNNGQGENNEVDKSEVMPKVKEEFIPDQQNEGDSILQSSYLGDTVWHGRNPHFRGGKVIGTKWTKPKNKDGTDKDSNKKDDNSKKKNTPRASF